MVQNLGSFGFTAANSFLSTDGGGTDQLYQMYGYIGNASGVVAVDASNFSVVSTITATANIASSTVRLNASGAAVLGLATGEIEIDYTFTLVDDTGPLDADSFSWQADIANLSTAALDLVFYRYLDLDLGGAGDFGDDIASSNAYRIMVRDPDDPDAFVWESLGGPVDHFEVSAYAGLQNTLDNMAAATDLSDTAAYFGPADFTAAFQNDLIALVAGDTASIGVTIVANPEPNTGVLLGLGLAAMSGARRRQLAAQVAQSA